MQRGDKLLVLVRGGCEVYRETPSRPSEPAEELEKGASRGHEKGARCRAALLKAQRKSSFERESVGDLSYS